jgi:hypothetical protein
MSSVVTLRLPNETAQRLKACARRAGRSVSEVGALSIEEWLRQNEFADIEFRAFGGERHACLKGAPQVWQVVLVAQGYGLDAERTAEHFMLPVRRVQAAFNYYQVYSDEIDQAIADNRATTFGELRRLLPGTESMTVSAADLNDDQPS